MGRKSVELNKRIDNKYKARIYKEIESFIKEERYYYERKDYEKTYDGTIR